MRRALTTVKVNLYKFYDQRVLRQRVWPLVAGHALVHDSYSCRKGGLGDTVPWPTRRKGTTYVGFGPSKGVYRRRIAQTPCPVECRPSHHKDWKYC